MKCTPFQRKAAVVASLTLAACLCVSFVLPQMGANAIRGPPGVDAKVRAACETSGECVVDAALLDIKLDRRNGWSVLQAHAKRHHSYTAAVEMGDEVMMLGGWEGDEAHRVCHLFSPATGVYRACDSFKEEFHSGSAVYVKPYLYILGGSRLTSPSKIAYRAELLSNTATAGWENIPKPPVNFMGGNCHAVEKKIYCFFGKLNNKPITYSNKVFVFDTQTLEWDDSLPAQADPRGRMYAVSAMVGSKIYFFGGLTRPETGNGARNLGDVLVFDVATGKWEDGKQQMPGRVYGGSALAVSDNSIFVMGGFFSKETGGAARAVDIMWEYRIDTDTWVCHERMPYRAGGTTPVLHDNSILLLSGRQYGYRTTGYGVAYDLSTESLGECPLYSEEDLVPDMEFPQYKLPTADELVPGGFSYGANPRLD